MVAERRGGGDAGEGGCGVASPLRWEGDGVPLYTTGDIANEFWGRGRPLMGVSGVGMGGSEEEKPRPSPGGGRGLEEGSANRDGHARGGGFCLLSCVYDVGIGDQGLGSGNRGIGMWYDEGR